jgi:hypothetical protein
MDDEALRQQWRELIAQPFTPGAVGC